MMNSFSLWQRWLFVVALVITVFGLLLAFFSQTALFDFLFNNQINSVFWSASQAPRDVTAFQGWVYGVLGATVAGWGIFLTFIIYYPFRRREKWAWNCVALGIIVWFVVDTAISLYFSVYFNALFNTVLLVAALVPLAFSRNAFLEV